MEKKDRKYKITVFLVLLCLVLAATVLRWKITRTEQERNKEEQKQEVYYVRQKEKADVQGKRALTEANIYRMKGQPEDNMGNQDAGITLKFAGYEEHPEQFGWLKGEDWTRFQKELCGYLEKKEIEATTVTLHPDSQQVQNEYVRYLYMDVDYATEYADTLLIKATCDTYQDALRFAFAIQYGD